MTEISIISTANTLLIYQEFCKERLIIQCSAHLLPVCIPSRDFPAAAHLRSRRCNSLCVSIWPPFSTTSSVLCSTSFFSRATINLHLQSDNHIWQLLTSYGKTFYGTRLILINPRTFVFRNRARYVFFNRNSRHKTNSIIDDITLITMRYRCNVCQPISVILRLHLRLLTFRVFNEAWKLR